MSQQSAEIVEIEDGKHVLMPYQRACRNYVLGWIMALSTAALLFVNLGTHELTTGRIEDTAFVLAQLWLIVAVALLVVRRYRPVEFYEWVEE